MVKFTNVLLGACVAFGCFATPSFADATMGADIFKKREMLEEAGENIWK